MAVSAIDERRFDIIERLSIEGGYRLSGIPSLHTEVRSGPSCRNHPEVTRPIVPCSRCHASFCADCLVIFTDRAYCVDCKEEHLRDVASGVFEPKRLRLATIGSRFIATMVDGLLIGVPIVLIIMFVFGISIFKETPSAVPWWASWIEYLTIPFVIIYEGAMLSRRGQTLGKMMMRIRVVDAGGGAITTKQAWGRAVVQNVMASYLSVLNYLPAFFTKEKTCLHDLAAKTRVVSID